MRKKVKKRDKLKKIIKKNGTIITKETIIYED